jgi:uncharacterized protein YjbI with pentapeptide repeats
MAFHLRSLFTAEKTEEPSVDAQKGEKAPVEHPASLISATELPSAADTLAELFPDEQPPLEQPAPEVSLEAVLDGVDPAPVEPPQDPEIPLATSAPSSSGHLSVASSDWALEETLACHREWVESQGEAGKRADLTSAELEEAELIGINLRFADLHDANLKGADLLLADLRDACLVRTNLEESCLVGANLEGANLESAALSTAMGLLPRQLAGTDLHDASLPPQILEFHALEEFERASQTAFRLFATMTSLSILSWLIIWRTKDMQLLADTSIIPFLHSPAAAAALPTAEFYLIAPALLFIIYFLFHFHLQRLWDSVLELPAIFPNGRDLGHNEPRIVIGLLRSHFRWMNQNAPSTRLIEKVLSLLMAYWLVPVTLVFFWMRYLTLQEIHGTILQELLIVAATCGALYSTTKAGQPPEKWVTVGKAVKRRFARFRKPSLVSVAIGLCAFLTLLSAGTTKGVPHDPSRAPQFGPANIRRWTPDLFWLVDFDPYANLTESVISTKPSDWTGTDEQVPYVKGAHLNNTNFRYAQGYGVFLVNAHLRRADFEGAFLSEADLRGADLSQSNLRLVNMDRAAANHANLDRADLDGSNLTRIDLRGANLSYSSLVGALLVDARLDGASLYGAQLPGTTLVRAGLEKADLRDAHLENANLDHADLQQAYLWSAKLSGALLENAHLGAAIFIDADLHGADLRGAQFAGTVLDGADLTGTNLDGADLRGALQLSANQICSAKSREGALLDDAMQAPVDIQCGAMRQGPSNEPSPK